MSQAVVVSHYISQISPVKQTARGGFPWIIEVIEVSASVCLFVPPLFVLMQTNLKKKRKRKCKMHHFLFYDKKIFGFFQGHRTEVDTKANLNSSKLNDCCITSMKATELFCDVKPVIIEL